MGILSGPRFPEHEVFGERFVLRLAYGKVPRPAYAYGIYQAAQLAVRLGLPKISVIEFGVAGGMGLVAMEQIACEVEKIFPIVIEIFGFDGGFGLPAPIDYRDLPYTFAQGSYEMDETRLRMRLKRAQLVLGLVADTVPIFLKQYASAPIGFVAFDLDLYSSTSTALALFKADQECLLPRVFCYFDDIISDDFSICNEWVGELLAIKEFNEQHKHRKIAPVYGLRHRRSADKKWSEKVIAVRAAVLSVVPPGQDFILIGSEQLDIGVVRDRRALPFLERNGSYWGLPPDDDTAISEIERMRHGGADFIFFSNEHFWWLDHYVGFNRYLSSNFVCIVDTADLVAFDLRRRNWAAAQRWLRGFLLRRFDLSVKYREAIIALNAERDEMWNDQIFVLHAFDHGLYNRYILPVERPQAPLE